MHPFFILRVHICNDYFYDFREGFIFCNDLKEGVLFSVTITKFTINLQKQTVCYKVTLYL